MSLLINAKWLRLVWLTFTLAALTGCALITGDDGRYNPTPLTEYKPGLSARIAWKSQVGKGSGIGFVPQVVGSVVYAAAADGSLGKFDLASGTPVWVAKVDNKLSAGVGSDGKTTAVVTTDGTVVALDDNGQIKWRSKASSEVTVPPVVGLGVVVVRSGDYRVQAFNAETGERIWSVQRPGPALALRAPARMLLLEGLVISAIPGGKLIAINAVSGDVQWEGTVALSKGSTDLERVNDVVGLPALSGSLLCAVAFQGRVVCFDIAAGGRTVWSKDFSSSVGLTIDATQVYVPNEHDALSAFSLKNGGLTWRQDALRNRKLTSPAALPGAVAVGDLEGFVHFLSLADGQLLARILVGGGAISAPLVTTSQGVLVQSGDGLLVLIGLN
jgi:outer membrane protein assembly factor BamB